MQLLVRIFKRILWIVFHILPVNQNKIVFQAYYGRGYGDNPKYIAEELLRRGKTYDFVWVTNGIEDPHVPAAFRTVRFRSVRYIYEMSTARVWVDNARKEYCHKKRGQFYMQTWHGSLGMKKVENQVPDKLSPKYIQMAMRDAAQCDVMISSCRTLTKNYREDFWYPTGEIIEKGLPRNDRLFSYTPDDVTRIRAALGLSEDVRVLLYAPTFRDDHNTAVYNIDYCRCQQALEKRFGGEWRILVRLHPNVFRCSEDITFDPQTVINASYYPDIQELYMIADALITDYSSVIFDFLLLERPSFLYASDIEKYRKERDYYFDFAELPFTLCQNNDELETALLTFDGDAYMNAIHAFKEKHGLCEAGDASAYAADWIETHMAANSGSSR